MVDTFILGKPGLNIDTPEKIAGRARYAIDMALPGTLQARVLRSPHPHAKIVSIDTSRAKALPGVHAIITASDLPVVGDRVYGAPDPELRRQFLHAARLAFVHPFTGEEVDVRSPLPPDLQAFLDGLGDPA